MAKDSITIALYPVAGCLKVAEKLLGKNRIWKADNDSQKKLLQLYELIRDDVNKLDEIDSIASADIDEVNAFLAERGFDIRLRKFDEHSIALASVFKLLLEWIKEGSKASIINENDGEEFEAVRFDGKNSMIFTSDNHNHPVAQLQTKNGDEVFVTAIDSVPDDIFDIIAEVDKINDGLVISSRHEGVVMPMLDYDEQVDISWTKGLATNDEDGFPWFVAQALQQTKCKLNEKGVKVESAVSMTMMRGMALRKELVLIDKPFLMWIERPGLKVPFFVGYFTEKHWKNPGNL